MDTKSEWQFNNGKPMIFVGQIELKQDKNLVFMMMQCFMFLG